MSNEELASRRLQSFQSRCGSYGETALKLACHAALPAALNPELVHLLRINFFLDAPETLPYEVESDLLLSSLCREIGDNLYEIDPDLRNLLLNILAKDCGQQRIREVATLLWQYIERCSPWSEQVELERAQQLTALNFLAPQKARQWLEAAEKKAGSAASVEKQWFVAMRRELDELAQIELNEEQKSPFPPLLSFKFDVVIIDKTGKQISKKGATARYYAEDLGNGITLEMVAIPGGKFQMGTEDEEIERLVKKFNWDGYRREKPQHEVTVQPFFMGKYPITQAQWLVIASRIDLKVERDIKPDPSYFKGDNRPVEQVSWYDAVEFCARLSKLTGREYRLPSEAEWEYACRAGTSTAFYFGETITGELANYDASYTYADEPKGEDRGETTSVGQFPPNAFGLYDMHGNVWEWCADTWHDNYEGAPNDGSPWLRNDNDYQVLRGGSWDYYPAFCRSAFRDWGGRGGYGRYGGFRVVCVSGRTL
jgi:formylglycine-generating enzyme required for sulfatase activity